MPHTEIVLVRKLFEVGMFFPVSSELCKESQRDVVNHIEAVVKALFPGSGIEYVSCAGESIGGSQGCDHPARQPVKGFVTQAMASVGQGLSEGYLITFGVMVRGDSGPEFWRLGFAKTFGPPDESWAIARVIQGEIENVFLHNAMSQVASMHARLPKPSWSTMVHNKGSVEVSIVDAGSQEVDEYEVVVIGPQSVEMDRRQFRGPTAMYSSLCYAADWALVVTAQPNLRLEVASEALATELLNPRRTASTIRRFGLRVSEDFVRLVDDDRPSGESLRG